MAYHKKSEQSDLPISFLKTDKSRIIEVIEEQGKFRVTGVYVRIEIPDIPLAGFHPKGEKPKREREAIQIKIGATDQDDSNGGGDEATARDPLYSALAPMPPEKVNDVIQRINKGERPRDICQNVGVHMKTFMKVYGKLKELGRLDVAYELNPADAGDGNRDYFGKPEE